MRYELFYCSVPKPNLIIQNNLIENFNHNLQWIVALYILPVNSPLHLLRHHYDPSVYLNAFVTPEIFLAWYIISVDTSILTLIRCICYNKNVNFVINLSDKNNYKNLSRVLVSLYPHFMYLLRSLYSFSLLSEFSFSSKIWKIACLSCIMISHSSWWRLLQEASSSKLLISTLQSKDEMSESSFLWQTNNWHRGHCFRTVLCRHWTHFFSSPTSYSKNVSMKYR